MSEIDSEPGTHWAPIVGRWRTTGYVVTDERPQIEGTDVYELLPGGHFLLHRVDVHVGGSPVRAVEIIGEVADNGRWLARSYDDTGATEVMTVEIRPDGSWRFVGSPSVAASAQVDRPVAISGGVRSTVTFEPDGTRMHALWERSDDGATWTDWMHITFTRDEA